MALQDEGFQLSEKPFQEPQGTESHALKFQVERAAHHPSHFDGFGLRAEDSARFTLWGPGFLRFAGKGFGAARTATLHPQPCLPRSKPHLAPAVPQRERACATAGEERPVKALHLARALRGTQGLGFRVEELGFRV